MVWIERFADALHNPRERDEAADAIRSLAEKIILRPGAKHGQIDVTLHGYLGTIFQWTTQKATRITQNG